MPCRKHPAECCCLSLQLSETPLLLNLSMLKHYLMKTQVSLSPMTQSLTEIQILSLILSLLFLSQSLLFLSQSLLFPSEILSLFQRFLSGTLSLSQKLMSLKPLSQSLLSPVSLSRYPMPLSQSPVLLSQSPAPLSQSLSYQGSQHLSPGLPCCRWHHINNRMSHCKSVRHSPAYLLPCLIHVHKHHLCLSLLYHYMLPVMPWTLHPHILPSAGRQA